MNHLVLCVDGDRNLCQIQAKALRGRGYTVATASDGLEALEKIRQEPPGVVLLDLILPRKDGFSVLEEIRRLDGPASQVPVVLFSGCSPTPAYAARANTLAASALLVKPVPLARLISIVAEQIGEPKTEIPVDAAEARRASARKASALSGSLERVPFPALLHHLHGLRATGLLHLANERKRKWIELRDGYPIAVRSNLMNECLGNFLARGGRISQADAAESHRRMQGGRLQGQILVAMELLTEEEVAAALRTQADEKLYEIFCWESGTFRFEFGGEVQRANSLGVERSPANLILHGVRTLFSLERIDRYLRDHRHDYLAPSQSPFYRFQEIDLDDASRNWLSRLDGSRRLADFLGDEARRRTIYALLATGLLELRGGIQTSRPASVASRAPRVEAPEDESLRSELTALAERFRDADLFEILGLPPTASDEQIQEAYERLSERTHPDRVSAASEAVKRLADEVYGHVARAYEVLSNARHRGEYLLDRRREEREAEEVKEGRRALEAEIQFQKGDARLNQRRYEEALECFGKALELYPEEGEHHAHYGWALHLCHPGDPTIVAEAIEHVKRGLKLAPNREKSYLFMGRLCKVIGRAGAAEKMFTRAVQVQPDCVEALRELRLINMRRKSSKGVIGRLFGR